MKQLLTILFLTLATVAKSQDTIKIPTHVAKQVVKDLVVCDSLKAVHELTVSQLTLTEQKLALKDGIINKYEQKDSLHNTHIVNLEKISNTQELYIKDLTKKNKQLKVKLLFTKITLSGIIAGLGYLYLTK